MTTLPLLSSLAASVSSRLVHIYSIQNYAIVKKLVANTASLLSTCQYFFLIKYMPVLLLLLLLVWLRHYIKSQHEQEAKYDRQNTILLLQC
jgi:hypothetical protein